MQISVLKIAATILIIALEAVILPVRSATFNSQILSTGSLIYSSDNVVTINVGNIVGLNNFSLGFQLDGPDIRTWCYSSELRSLAKQANFKLVRFFEHRLGKPCIQWSDQTKSGTWNWNNIDLLVERILEIGAEPLIVLGFYSWTQNRLSSTPEGMADDPNTGLPYPESWAAYCAEWVKHFKETGFPVRYYEIINEASFYFGWPAQQPKLGYFMNLYNSAYKAMKRENSEIKIGCDSSTFKKVLDYFITNGEPLDFISFHRYGLSSATQSDLEALEAAENKYLYESQNLWSPEQAVTEYYERRGKKLPIIMSEGNLCDDYDPCDSRTHTVVGAVYTALSIRAFVLKNFIYSIYFHFAGQSDEMGMVDINTKMPWYPYYVQQLIGQHLTLGDKIVESTSNSNDVRSLAWIHEGKIVILLIFKANHPQSVRLQGVSGQFYYYKIDNSIPWQTPALQDGIINYAETVTVNGYGVMLLKGIS